MLTDQPPSSENQHETYLNFFLQKILELVAPYCFELKISKVLNQMMLNPLFRGLRRGLFPLAQAERQIRQLNKIANRILRSRWLILNRSIQRMHNRIQQQSCLALAHCGATPQGFIAPVAILPPERHPHVKSSVLTSLRTTLLIPLQHDRIPFMRLRRRIFADSEHITARPRVRLPQSTASGSPFALGSGGQGGRTAGGERPKLSREAGCKNVLCCTEAPARSRES